MTSHLSISYTASPAAGAPAAAPAASAQAPNPLGLLGAIFDQLLAGAVTDPTTASTAASDAATVPLGVATPLATPQPLPQGLDLLDTLADQLGDLQDQLDGGDEPDRDKLQALSDTIDALTILLAAPAPAATPATPEAAAPTGDAPPAGISAIAAFTPPPMAPSAPQQLADLATTLASTLGATPPAIQTALALPDDQAAALLQSLGLVADTPDTSTLTATGTELQSGTSATPVTPAPAASNDAVALLSRTLADLGVALTSSDPVIARKLETLSTAVSTAHDDAGLLARLDPKPAASTPAVTATAPPAVSDRTALDSIIARLDAPRAATLQIAVPVATPAALPEAKTQTQVAVRADDAEPVTQTPAASSATAETVPVEKVLKLTALTLTPTPAKPETPAKSEQPAVSFDTADTTSRTDPVQPSQQAAPAPITQPAHSPRILPAAYQSASHPINMGQVAFEMVRQAHQGLSRFAIRLDPPELGRVDVRMNVDPSGAVTAKLTVDRPETLDMFQRDQRTLERALQQAGLDSTRTTLEFSLRQNSSNPFAGMSGGDQRHSGSSSPYSRLASADDDAVPLASVTTLYRGAASAGGVNLFV